MRVHPVDTDLCLPDDRLVDIFLLQCYSPRPTENVAPAKLSNQLRESRLTFLESFRDWMRDVYCQENNDRPYFVVTPELAISSEHLPVLREIAQAGENGGVVMAGLEFQSWAEYVEILNSLPSMPEPESWVDGGGNQHIVNAAAILINDNSGTLHEYIQPKRNPSEGEANTHFPCQNTLFFRSIDQANARRLNFSVQICSDFTNPQIVDEFRRTCAPISDNRPIDFTFLLQRNPDQFSDQFRNSIAAYFAPPDEILDTSRGCLIFANTASSSSEPGEPLGDSMMLFPLDSVRWRTPGSPTYWLHDDQAHNYQAVVFREPGNCLYWLRYKPHYLVDRVAGTGQPGPFYENHAMALKFTGDDFPAQPEFQAIFPVSHWLLTQWSFSRERFLEQLQNSASDEVVTACRDSHTSALAGWHEILDQNDECSRRTVRLFFACYGDQILSEKTIEPVLWGEQFEADAKRLLATYAHLDCGLPNGALVPKPTQGSHAVVNGNVALSIVLGNDKRVRTILASTLKYLEAEAENLDFAKHILVILTPADLPSGDELNALVTEICKPIFHSNDDDGDVSDDITRGQSSREIIPVYDQNILSLVTSATDLATVQQKLPELLQVAPS